jgi:16S rRNA (cytosine967-C5)-methyltransferase
MKPHDSQAAPPPGYPVRRAAYEILRANAAGKGFLKDLFPAAEAEFSPEDRSLLRNLCLGTLRQRRFLDAAVDHFAPKGIKDPKLRQVLRLGAYQILFMRIPSHAAVSLSVDLAKDEAGKAQSGFVNALLKSLSREGWTPPPGQRPRELALRYSYPDWLADRWSKRLTPKALEEAFARGNEEAPLYLRCHVGRISSDEFAARVQSEGLQVESVPDAPAYFRLQSDPGKALRSELFTEGFFSFQDPISHFVLKLLDAHPGHRVLDACGAPGGKSAALAEAWGNRGEGIVIGDISAYRLQRARDAQSRLGLQGLRLVAGDPKRAAFKISFDRVLIDAPCSNLGVLRRRPEARWSHSPKDIRRQAVLQAELLRAGARLTAPGGRLVYAVCSPDTEEGWDLVGAFLKQNPTWRLVPAETWLPSSWTKKGCLWSYPGETEWDGFFAAALEAPSNIPATS